MPIASHNRRYGIRHRELRRQLKRLVESGNAFCARCKEPIAPDELWDLGHRDDDPLRHSGPEHRSCNRSAGGKTRARQLFGPPPVRPPEVTSRRW